MNKLLHIVPKIYFPGRRKDNRFILTVGTEEEGRCLVGVARGFPQVNSEKGHLEESVLAANADEMVSLAMEKKRNVMLVCACLQCVCLCMQVKKKKKERAQRKKL